MSKTAAKKKPFKATPATTRRSRADVVRQIADGTDLKPGKVKEVFDALGALIAADLGKKGCGEFNVGSSRVDLQACKLEYSIVSPK